MTKQNSESKRSQLDAPRSIELSISIPRLQSDIEGSELDKHPLAKSINAFEKRIRDIVWGFAIAVPNAQRWQARLMRSFAGKQRAYLRAMKDRSGSEQAEAVAGVLDTARSIESLLSSQMPSSIMAGLFMELFCEFDNYLGDLVRGINSLDESIFYHLKREITIGELKGLSTIDALRDDLLEKEIETLRRESYPRQFQTLEKNYELTLTKFDEWPRFVEASQRRNLFTHAGGVVSDQYLAVCLAHGIQEGSLPRKGEVLPLNQDYFFETARVVELTGLLLGQTLWRKLFNKDLELADTHLNGVIYEKLRLGNFAHALRFADYGLQPMIVKQASGVSRRIRVINKAIALSCLNRVEEAKRLLADEDWTDTLRDFALARAVLEDRYEDAATLMRKIGKEGELVSEPAYRNWPLFWKFRVSSEFLNAYESVFGYSFSAKVAASASEGQSNVEPSKPSQPSSKEMAPTKIRTNSNLSTVEPRRKSRVRTPK